MHLRDSTIPTLVATTSAKASAIREGGDRKNRAKLGSRLLLRTENDRQYD